VIHDLYLRGRRLIVSSLVPILGEDRKRRLADWKDQRKQDLAYLKESLKARSPWAIKLKRDVPQRPRIGMAVLAYERPEYLELCLDSLFRTKLYDYDVTFLLQDDGSTDPRVRELLERPRDPQYKIIQSFTPKGPNFAGAAINKALRRLLELDEFDIVGWCDSDAIHHPEWLKKTMEICLWAKRHHRDQILGPFSSFNSSNQDFHRVLGQYESPHGGYLVKRQMGMLNYFYFREDLLKLGYFAENRDDETVMTEHFERLGVRNYCTEESFVEHAGHISTLNPGRPTPVVNPVYGLNLPREGWGPELAESGTLGYFRFVNSNLSWESGTSSAEPLEVFLLTAAKDVSVAPYAIEGVRRNLKHPLRRISIIGPDIEQLRLLAKDCDCTFVDENSLLPLKLSDLNLPIQGINRSGWMFQQLLKLAIHRICETSRYYTIDSDTVLLRPIRLEVDGKTVLYHSDEHHEPYFRKLRQLLGIEPRTPLSFVAHQMCFQPDRVAEMLKLIESRFPEKSWHQTLIDTLDLQEVSDFSEFETYGQWMLATHPAEIHREYFFNLGLTREKLTSVEQLEKQYGGEFNSLSFHGYMS